MNNTELIAKLLVLGFIPVGSRSILPELIKDHTDYDFIGIESPANRTMLAGLGFECSLDKHDDNALNTDIKYGDKASSSIWEKDNVDVVLKHAEYYPLMVRFWEFMEANPVIFKTKFWKSWILETETFEFYLQNESVTKVPCLTAMNSKDKIATELNFWIDYILPSL